VPRITAPLAGAKKTLALGSYVEKKDFPLDAMFEAIERFRPEAERIRALLGVEGDGDQTVLGMVSALFVEDEVFMDYVTERGYLDGPNADALWKTACDALAWTIMDKYSKHVAEAADG
jgi:hypothetical protein